MRKIKTFGKYILDKKGKPKIVKDLMTWANWFENSRQERIVQQTFIGKIKISTVFLSLDHRFSGKGKPILWETMIFGSKHEALYGYQVRYTSLSGAKKGHKHAVEFVRYILSTKKKNICPKKKCQPKKPSTKRSKKSA